MVTISTYSKIRKGLVKLLPLLVLLLLLIFFFYFRLGDYLTFTTLKTHEQTLQQWTKEHFWLMSLRFTAIYIIATAISIPGSLFLTLAGGFLFGILYGTVLVVIAATIGATLLYLIVRFALAEWVEKKISGKLALMQQGLQADAFHYLLTVRLIPIFPFWLVNIVPALFKIPVKSYVVATFLGIIPGSLVYVSLGNSLHQLFQTNEIPNLGIIFNPMILLPLIGLGLLSLLPVIYKRLLK